MPIYEKENLVFIHIPKTAGTSIRRLLDETLGKGIMPIKDEPHCSCSDIKDFNKYRAFCVIRDPVERAKSYYKWFKVSTDKDKYPFKKLANKLDFNSWVEEWFLPEAKPQYSFFMIGDKVPSNILICTFENLYTDLNTILNIKYKLNVDLKKMKHIFNTGSNDDIIAYDEIMYEIIRKETNFFKLGGK